jgi:hypothetical protein
LICCGRSAIVHIGTEKTGTTTIQELLARQRKELADLGFWYPFSPGPLNHTGLAIYSAPENMPGMDATVPWAVRNERFEENLFAQQLKDEIAGLPRSIHTVIFSNEHCHSRVIEYSQVKKLADLLSRHFKTTKVLIYLRRQDEMACSAYSTQLRYGYVSFGAMPRMLRSADCFFEGYWPRYFDFEHLLDRYAAVFDKTSIMPRLYEWAFQENSNLVSDFLRVCGLPAGLNDNASRANRALSADGLAFLAMLNARISHPSTGQDAQLSATTRDVCLPIIESRLIGPTFLPSCEEAKRFYAQFSDMNERVRAAWFPERVSLFSDDFRQYPETVDGSDLALYQRAMRAAFVIIDDLIKKLPSKDS